MKMMKFILSIFWFLTMLLLIGLFLTSLFKPLPTDVQFMQPIFFFGSIFAGLNWWCYLDSIEE